MGKTVEQPGGEYATYIKKTVSILLYEHRFS